MTIWKFNLLITDRQVIRMPQGAKVLSVAAQDDSSATLQLWAEVDPTAPEEDRHFAIFGTGNPSSPGSFIGTVLMHGGALVWHVYEVAA